MLRNVTKPLWRQLYFDIELFYNTRIFNQIRNFSRVSSFTLICPQDHRQRTGLEMRASL